MFITDNYDYKQPPSHFEELRKELIEKFGGVTIYRRQPVEGFWQEAENSIVQDDLLIYEVLANNLDLSYWQSLKLKLEQLLKQKELLIRHSDVSVI